MEMIINVVLIMRRNKSRLHDIHKSKILAAFYFHIYLSYYAILLIELEGKKIPTFIYSLFDDRYKYGNQRCLLIS